jgi:hypothetical protein
MISVISVFIKVYIVSKIITWIKKKKKEEIEQHIEQSDED